MYQDVVIVNGPVVKDGIADYERVKITARPLGRPHSWNNGLSTNGGFDLVYEAEDGSVWIQNVEWETEVYPSPVSNPRTYYYYETYPSLAAAREGWRGWLIRYALGDDNPFSQ